MENINWLSEEDIFLLEGATDFPNNWSLPDASDSSSTSNVKTKRRAGELQANPNRDASNPFKYAESSELSKYISTEVLPNVEFEILSTIRFDMTLAPPPNASQEIPEECFFLVRLHHKRMEYTLQFFRWQIEIPFDHLLSELRAAVSGLDLTQAYKLRVLINKEGQLIVETSGVPPRLNLFSGLTINPGPEYVVFLDSDSIMVSPFTSFKTTYRAVYNASRNRTLQTGPHAPPLQEVLLYNPRNELTEGSITNIAVYRDGGWKTPPLGVGCLCGVVRHYLLSKKVIQEKTISRRSLVDGECILLFNGIIGVCRGTLRLIQ